jgi:predicted dehydrogenase
MIGAIGVAVVGCGLIGRRRARCAAAHPATRLVGVADLDGDRARAVVAEAGGEVIGNWRSVLERDDVHAVAVCTPNDLLAGIACAALERGKHVLIEKPMGRSYEEARQIAAAAAASGRVFRVGFNHRYHPALSRARALAQNGFLGELLAVRARYGHGGRPGCEGEWRADPQRAGGGELMDQGVHVADLIHWFAGLPTDAFCLTQTAFWRIEPLEDNAFGLFRWEDGRVAQLHVSMTQWKNLFSFEVIGRDGSLVVDGLGGGYGVERLTMARRRPEGGVPEMREEVFDGPDSSWTEEWDDFARSIAAHTNAGGVLVRNGDAEAGLAAMRMIDALYRSAAEGCLVRI